MKSLHMPQPHPLDFDWRFEQRSANEIVSILPQNEPVLCLGAPTIARILEKRGLDSLLIDRQPIQGVGNHQALSVELSKPINGYARTAVLDAPWYPKDLLLWLRWAAHAVDVGGTVIFPVWPKDTRPKASNELQEVKDVVSSWAEFEETGIQVRYETSLFEQISESISQSSLASSPRIGPLCKITVKSKPALGSQEATDNWLRLIVDNYQLAFSLSHCQQTENNRLTDRVERLQWPYVSRRAPGRESIRIWSSLNEVSFKNLDMTELKKILQLRNARRDINNELESVLNRLRESQWSVPVHPYRRLVLWTH